MFILLNSFLSLKIGWGGIIISCVVLCSGQVSQLFRRLEGRSHSQRLKHLCDMMHDGLALSEIARVNKLLLRADKRKGHHYPKR